MVNLTRIYTRTGDGGRTRLGDMSETTKNDPRLHAYADVDEANAQLGAAVAHGLEESVRVVLIHVQNDLFDVGADLCTPVVADPESRLRSTAEEGALRITQEYVDRLDNLAVIQEPMHACGHELGESMFVSDRWRAAGIVRSGG